jgi:hypothetical protein
MKYKLGNYFRLTKDQPFHKKGKYYPHSLEPQLDKYIQPAGLIVREVIIENRYDPYQILLKVIGKELFSWVTPEKRKLLSALELLALEAA